MNFESIINLNCLKDGKKIVATPNLKQLLMSKSI